MLTAHIRFRLVTRFTGALLVLVLLAAPAIAAEEAGKAPAGKQAVAPAVEKLVVTPPRLVLSGKRDSRRLIVSGSSADGREFDLTTYVQLTAGNDLVTIDADGFVVPRKVGTTTVKGTVGKKSIDIPVEIKDVTDHPVSFVREVIPAISKVGCNAGTCHGAQKGKKGFKLSLRG